MSRTPRWSASAGGVSPSTRQNPATRSRPSPPSLPSAPRWIAACGAADSTNTPVCSAAGGLRQSECPCRLAAVGRRAARHCPERPQQFHPPGRGRGARRAAHGIAHGAATVLSRGRPLLRWYPEQLAGGLERADQPGWPAQPVRRPGAGRDGRVAASPGRPGGPWRCRPRCRRAGRRARPGVPAPPGASSACPRSGRGGRRRSGSGGRRCRSTRSAGCPGRPTAYGPRRGAAASASLIVAVLQVDGGHHAAGPARPAVQPPAAHVVAAGDHAGPDALGDPGLGDEVADLGLDPHEVAGAGDAEPRGVAGWIQTGLVCASSSSHLAFADRVWIWVGQPERGQQRPAGRPPARPGARGS